MKILIINPFGIGDCLFTTPLISAIKKEWPNSYVGFWCNERVSELLKANPKIDKVWGLSRGDIKRKYGNFSFRAIKSWIGLYREIMENKFDVSLDFSLDQRYGLMTKLAGIKKRIGFDYKCRGRFLNKRIEISGYNDRHIVEYYLQLLEFIGVREKAPRLELCLDEKNSSWAKGFLAGANIAADCVLIGISPGAGESWGKDAAHKRWEPEKFAQVANIVLKSRNSRILLFGNLADKDVCGQVYNNIDDKSRVSKIYPQFSLNEFSALLANCALLLTNDGGPLHMAVALGVKTVSIFGPVSEIVYGPYPKSGNHIVIKANFNCRPCYRNFRFPQCVHGRQCLSDIGPEIVAKSVESLL